MGLFWNYELLLLMARVDSSISRFMCICAYKHDDYDNVCLKCVHDLALMCGDVARQPFLLICSSAFGFERACFQLNQVNFKRGILHQL